MPLVPGPQASQTFPTPPSFEAPNVPWKGDNGGLFNTPVAMPPSSFQDRQYRLKKQPMFKCGPGVGTHAGDLQNPFKKRLPEAVLQDPSIVLGPVISL